MAKQLTVTIFEGTEDCLGKGETAIMFENRSIFVSMLFGGRDGMQRDSITLDELRQIFDQMGIDV